MAIAGARPLHYGSVGSGRGSWLRSETDPYRQRMSTVNRLEDQSRMMQTLCGGLQIFVAASQHEWPACAATFCQHAPHQRMLGSVHMQILDVTDAGNASAAHPVGLVRRRRRRRRCTGIRVASRTVHLVTSNEPARHASKNQPRLEIQWPRCLPSSARFHDASAGGKRRLHTTPRRLHCRPAADSRRPPQTSDMSRTLALLCSRNNRIATCFSGPASSTRDEWDRADKQCRLTPHVPPG